ncbi:hypothetical protein O7599_00085 [Streptomyces sp. WMMC500]|nr:hypothetical protein [Streptomyces sp. WMMC500]WBB61001.1 hypothetical protein O7599_00085 [Streptomyces sp. WMMC500]
MMKMGHGPEEYGFKVTKAIKKDTAEIPKDVIPDPAILCATKEG